MTRQQAHQFGPRIAAGSENGDIERYARQGHGFLLHSGDVLLSPPRAGNKRTGMEHLEFGGGEIEPFIGP
ncbi:hypothetical protein JCM17960_27470 [Magnetospira thiophila]